MEKEKDQENRMGKIWNECVQSCHYKIGGMNWQVIVCRVCQEMNWMGCSGEFNLKFSKVCAGWRMIQ